MLQKIAIIAINSVRNRIHLISDVVVYRILFINSSFGQPEKFLFDDIETAFPFLNSPLPSLSISQPQKQKRNHGMVYTHFSRRVFLRFLVFLNSILYFLLCSSEEIEKCWESLISKKEATTPRMLLISRSWLRVSRRQCGI